MTCLIPRSHSSRSGNKSISFDGVEKDLLIDLFVVAVAIEIEMLNIVGRILDRIIDECLYVSM